MRSFVNLLAVATAVSATCNAADLFVAQSDGFLTTLSLLEDAAGKRSLNVSSRTGECKPNAAGIELDFDNRILYCTDRGSGASAKRGNLTSFSIGEAGLLAVIDRTTVPPQGVAGSIFGPPGNRGLISASYNKSAIAVVKIDVDGVLGQLSPTIQEIYPTIKAKGPVASRQDRSYSHDVLISPDGDYVFISEMGGDGYRVFEYNTTSLELLELPMLESGKGVGPRHGAFYTSDSGELSFFFVGELSQNVYWYSLDISADGVSWKKKFEIPALGLDGVKPDTTAPTSEIAITPDNKFVIVSNREISFTGSTQYKSGPTDTLSTFSINADGTLTLIQLAPSGGWSPRQFSINKAGDLIAVGHQNNRTVIIWERDLKTGKIITAEEGGPVANITLSGSVVVTLWDE